MWVVRQTETFRKKFEKIIPKAMQEKLLEKLRKTKETDGKQLAPNLKEKRYKKWSFYFFSIFE